MTSAEEVLISAILESVRQRRREARLYEDVNTKSLEGLAKSAEAAQSMNPGDDPDSF